ncbi:hypothetical protein BDB13_6089 [Rhodococcus sp. OK302]|nr:hypothetical protein BDB13_6089 [Rhodococcus sp. OK302]
MKNRFQRQLNTLFYARGRPTNAVVAKALAANGHPISTPYISQLRCGKRTFPSGKVVASLAKYFDVPPEYFFAATNDAGNMYSPEADRQVLHQLEADHLRELGSLAVDLSPASLDLLVKISEQLRLSERLPRVPPDATLTFKGFSRHLNER